MIPPQVFEALHAAQESIATGYVRPDLDLEHATLAFTFQDGAILYDDETFTVGNHGKLDLYWPSS